jgi:hypothetical protein
MTGLHVNERDVNERDLIELKLIELKLIELHHQPRRLKIIASSKPTAANTPQAIK